MTYYMLCGLDIGRVPEICPVGAQSVRPKKVPLTWIVLCPDRGRRAEFNKAVRMALCPGRTAYTLTFKCLLLWCNDIMFLELQHMLCSLDIGRVTEICPLTFKYYHQS
uniref:Uncharacterized protein n=1 Tax=Strigamia maritima TaxID=126957 RepID=T1JHR7_STRMM